jgi:hypothetical protein
VLKFNHLCVLTGALIDEPEAVAVSSAMQSAAPGITMSALPVDSGMAMTLPASHAQVCFLFQFIR